jgi:hypothetical protein
MIADEYQMRAMIERVKQTESFAYAKKLVYQWVKQDKINPKQMAELIILAHKLHTY